MIFIPINERLEVRVKEQPIIERTNEIRRKFKYGVVKSTGPLGDDQYQIYEDSEMVITRIEYFFIRARFNLFMGLQNIYLETDIS